MTICRRCVEPLLAPGEMVEADAGCRGDKTTQQPKDHCCRSEKMAKKKAASRHEAANGRLDNFRCLRSQFRHNGHEHKHYFHTLVVVTQLMLRRHGQHPLSCQNKVIVSSKVICRLVLLLPQCLMKEVLISLTHKVTEGEVIERDHEQHN